MTEEEKHLAEEWWNTKDYPARCKGNCMEAFHAGYKAGKPKWHKVADGDVPCDNRDVLSDKGEIVYYDNINGYWIDNKASVEIDNVDAWCEIPKFEEE